uniref:Uncharacterized protein n=1 Tax=Amphimedon queenslandica TaxID=400682 RepID=A0A1X7T2M5_AMPQE
HYDRSGLDLRFGVPQLQSVSDTMKADRRLKPTARFTVTYMTPRPLTVQYIILTVVGTLHTLGPQPFTSFENIKISASSINAVIDE